MSDKFGPELLQVINVLQTALTPAFMISAVTGFLGVLNTRFARLVDRAKEIQNTPGGARGQEFASRLEELRLLDKRLSLINWSILLSSVSAVVICFMIAMLFGMGLVEFSMASIITSTFMIALALLAMALLCYV